jgi:hypothetical protein
MGWQAVRKGFRFSLTSFEQFNQPRKIEGCLARFLKGESSGLPRLHRIGLAVECTKPPPLSVLDGIAALQFVDLPWGEPKPYYRVSVAH